MAKNGRPTKYDEKYCAMLIEHMSAGFSFESFGGIINVCKDTLYEWVRVHEEFSYSKNLGRMKSLCLFEQIGMEAITGKRKEFNNTMYIFTAKNRHPDMFKDVHEVTGDVNKPLVLNYKLAE